MSEAEQEKYAEIVRKLIEHENTLQNYRFTWFSASQALLLAALGVSWEKALFVACTICLVGVITSLTAFIALRLCDLAYVQLSNWWNEHLRGYTGPPKQGFEGNYQWWMMPSKLLPWVFMFLWVALAVYRVAWYE